MNERAIAGLARHDAAAMAALHRACFTDPWDEDTFAALLAAPQTRAETIAAGGELAALVLWRHAADEAEVLTIAVAPGERRRGLAVRLLTAVAQAARVAGARRLFCEVAEDNAAARAVYRGLGFAEIGRRRGYYDRGTGPAVDALIACLDLA